MASTDWTELTASLSSGSLDRGVTSGIARPPGGGSFIYGFNSRDASIGAAGLFTNQVNFTPMASGATIRGCIQRGVSGGPLNFAPFLFLGLQGPSVSDLGYLLGLGDGDPHHIVLKKGSVLAGLPDLAPAPTTNGVLRRSTATYAPGTWLHIRLDMIVNLNGDVYLNALQNDLTVHPIGGAYTWVPIPGMDSFIDDVLAVNTGSSPFTSGRGGFAFKTGDVTRRGYFDQIEIGRQL